MGQAAARALEEAILREGPETVAAFIAEPIQGVGGVIVPPDDYFPLVRAICDKYDVLLIAGRGDHRLWAHGRTCSASICGTLRPDIMSFAKGITSGYMQLGGIQISDAIREVIESAPDGRHLDARLHLFGPRGGLRRGTQEPGDHRARPPGGERGARWANACAPGWRGCWSSALSATCAGAG